MPVNNEPDDLDDDDLDGQIDKNKLDDLRSRAKQARRFERENAELRERLSKTERETAFLSAGLSLTEKQQAAVLGALGDTELTADAVKAMAIEIGLAQPDKQETDDDQARRQAAEAQARIGQAQAGSTPPDPIPDLPTQIIAAEQAGEWDKALELKSQQLAQLAAG